jgi:hypothetical protein
MPAFIQGINDSQGFRSRGLFPFSAQFQTPSQNFLALCFVVVGELFSNPGNGYLAGSLEESLAREQFFIGWHGAGAKGFVPEKLVDEPGIGVYLCGSGREFRFLRS